MCQNSFSLYSDSFDKGSNNKKTIYNNLERLNNVNEKIKSFKDLVFIEEDIYIMNIIDNKQLHEIMFSNHHDFNQDYKTLLIEVVGKAKNSNGENYPKVGLNYIAGNIIYTEKDLMQFYYKCMEKTHDEEEFSICIKKYFENLKFQDKVDETLKTLKGGGLEFFIQDIMRSLVYLENEFKSVLAKNHNDVRKSLVELSSSIGIETTTEGNSDRKPDFTFEFENNDKIKVSICCEPHIKLSESSKSGDNTFYFNRLHFHVGRDDVEDGKILVGSIGYHL